MIWVLYLIVFFNSFNFFLLYFFSISDDQPLPLLENDKLDSLLNRIDWDRPLSPPDLNLPTDPDIITLLSSSSPPISPVVSPNQPPNLLVDKLLQSLTANPIQSTNNLTAPQHKSRAHILLPSLFASKAHSNKTQSEESQSIPSSPRRPPPNSTALGTTTQDARASFSRLNRFQNNQQVSEQKRRERYLIHRRSIWRPRFDPYLNYKSTYAFSSWEIVIWDNKRQEYSIQNTALSPQRLVVPLTAIDVQSVEWCWTHTHPYLSQKAARLFSIYRPELPTEMDTSTSEDITDTIVQAKCPKISSASISSTVSEQLRLLTTQVDQLRITSEQALEQTKPLIQTFPLANMKQFQNLHAVQQQVAQFFVVLNVKKRERLKLCTFIRQPEDELAQLRRQVNEPSTFSLPIPFTVDPPCSAAFQDTCALKNAQISKPSITITLKRTPSTTSKSRLPDQPRGSPASLPTSRSSSSDLDTRVKQLEEEITKPRNSRETILSLYRSQLLFSMTDFWPWSLETQTLSCGN